MDHLTILFAGQPWWAQMVVAMLALAMLAMLANVIIRRVILRAAAPLLDSGTRTTEQAAARLATVVPLVIVALGIGHVPHLPPDLARLIANLAQALIVLSVTLALSKALSYVDEVYRRRPDAASRPIKGYIQVLKIAAFCAAAVVGVSVLVEQSALLLLSGLGAMAAVLLLVFKDTILSLVASVQLTSNDMLRVGDWIDMPDAHADGDVIDIALHTVKVQNWDRSITTIPTYRLISESFRNWRAMRESGGRRIKRGLPIDQLSIRFLAEEEVAALRRFRLLEDYLTAKDAELRDWNAPVLEGGANPVNARRLTNIGTFRAYVMAYLRAHRDVHGPSLKLVRHLQPTAQGLPLEIYCFTNTTQWAQYEDIQSDIFDHLLAILPEFGLRVFQDPSGLDMRAAMSDEAPLLPERPGVA